MFRYGPSSRVFSDFFFLWKKRLRISRAVVQQTQVSYPLPPMFSNRKTYYNRFFYLYIFFFQIQTLLIKNEIDFAERYFLELLHQCDTRVLLFIAANRYIILFWNLFHIQVHVTYKYIG